MSSSQKPIVDLSVFDQQSEDSCKDIESCVYIKRILTLLKYYSLLQVGTNPDDQNIFNNFINTVYDVSSLIMDQFHLQKKHDDEIHEIMNHFINQYQSTTCDIKLCPYSSRLYRVQDITAEITIFDQEDKESVLPVFIDIISGIHHFIFHIFECGLRDIGDNNAGDHNDENNNENDEFYDAEFSRMSARIQSTTTNTQRFDRMNDSNKFEINLANDGISDINNMNNNQSEKLTYLDSIYSTLMDAGIEAKIIEQLANYVLMQQFDSESMDWDFQNGSAGNVEIYMENTECINCIKEMLKQITGM